MKKYFSNIRANTHGTMSVSESGIKALARIIFNYLDCQVSNPDGSKNPYRGNIPINLDAPFNMGEMALEQCHPELDGISWMQLLARITFTVSRQEEIPKVVMHYLHETHNFTYTAECAYSIKLNILQCAIETPTYKTLRALLYDVFQSIMKGFTRQSSSIDTQPECVCLAIWDSILPDQQANNKRKHDAVEP